MTCADTPAFQLSPMATPYHVLTNISGYVFLTIEGVLSFMLMNSFYEVYVFNRKKITFYKSYFPSIIFIKIILSFRAISNIPECMLSYSILIK